MKLNETELNDLQQYIDVGGAIRDLTQRLHDSITKDNRYIKFLNMTTNINDIETLNDIVTRVIAS